MKESWHQLNYITPNIYGVEHVPNPDLHSRIVKTRNYFRELAIAGEVELTDPHITARNYVWQNVGYHPNRPSQYYDSTRGYLMVEPDEIPQAVKIVDTIYQERKYEKKEGEFKWLMMKSPPILFTNDWWEYQNKESNLGIYSDLSPTDPRIVLYEYSTQDIQELLMNIASTKEWEAIEEKRRAKFPGNIPPIRGTNPFMDESGQTWYSLSFNAKEGHSKDQ